MGKWNPGVYILGITGNIGSGKSTVLQILQSWGAYTVSSDQLAKKYTDPHSPIREEIIQIFGIESFPFPDQPANRTRIAQIAFQDPEKKRALEKLIHPLVRRDFLQILEEISQDTYPHPQPARTSQNEKIVAWEVPLLFETDAHTLCDSTLTVYTTKETAKDRVEKRGGIPPQDFENRWNQQMDLEKKKSLSDFSLPNDNSIEELKKQIIPIWNHITTKR